MIFRGAQIQRDAHGRCGLLSKRILSSNTDELFPSDVLTADWDDSRQLPAIADHLNPKGTACGRLYTPKPVPCDASKTSGDWACISLVARRREHDHPNKMQRGKAEEAYRMAV